MSGGVLEACQALRDFAYMGGHGPYVWTVYVTAVTLVVANYVQLRLNRRRTLRTLRARHGHEDGLDRAPVDGA